MAMGVFDLKAGQNAEITAVRVSGAAGERLYSLGVRVGKTVQCRAFSLFRGSILLLAGYNRVAVRKSIADQIEVSLC